MQVRKLTPQLSVAPQLTPDELSAVAAQGFRTIINNRPDMEEAGQPKESDMAARAKEAGLAYAYQPVISGQISDQNIDDFAANLAKLDGPVLAFCRTGTRCTVLWALSQAGKMDTDQIMATAQQAGYDLAALRPRLEMRAALAKQKS